MTRTPRPAPPPAPALVVEFEYEPDDGALAEAIRILLGTDVAAEPCEAA